MSKFIGGLGLNGTIELEAKQFLFDTKEDVYNWSSEFQANISPSTDSEGTPILKIPVLYQKDSKEYCYWLTCEFGDYLVKLPIENKWSKFTVISAATLHRIFTKVE